MNLLPLFRTCLNNRCQSHFCHFRSGFSCFCRELLHTCRISIALVIHSLDPTLGLRSVGFRCYYTPSRSLSPSLFAQLRDLLSRSLSTRLIPLGLLEAGAQGISIARAIRLVDRTLQMYFSNRLLDRHEPN